MTITHVAGQSGNGSDSGVGPITVTMALTPVSGNVLIATYTSWYEEAVTSITETGVTWTPQIQYTASTYHFQVEIWLGVVGAGASKTVTVTHAAGSINSVVDIYEYSGIATTSFLDQTNYTSGGNGANIVTGSVTTTNNNELLIGVTVQLLATQSSAINGFTLYDGVQYNMVSNAYLEQIVSSTGTYQAGTNTATANGYGFAGCIATFKEATSTTARIASHRCMVGVGLQSRTPKFKPRMLGGMFKRPLPL